MTTPPAVERLGRYLLLHRIAVGGMAEIFVACDPEAPLEQQLLVVKRIRTELSRDSSFVDMFLDEARIFLHLSHPNIVHMYDFGEEDGRYYMALEYVWGDSLAALLRLCEHRRVQFPMGAALYIGGEIARALHHAHRLKGPDGTPWPVIHRDVTLGNVVISYHGDVKLLDFGIAKAKERLSRTAVGNVKGTLVYLAPEQILGLEEGPFTDVYQLGVLLYKTLVGREPVEGKSEAGIVTAIARGQITPPSVAIPGFPPPVEKILLKAMAFAPENRFASAGVLHHTIASLLGDHYKLGRQRLASLVAYVTRDRFQQQLSFINDLVRGVGVAQDPGGLFRWVETAREPQKLSVELSDVIALMNEDSGVTAQGRKETADVTAPAAPPPAAPAVKVAPGPTLTIDPRVQAALARAFSEPSGMTRPDSLPPPPVGGADGPAQPRSEDAGFPFREPTDIDLYSFSDVPTEIDALVFPSARALLGEQSGSVPTSPARPAERSGSVPTSPARPAEHSGSVPTSPARPAVTSSAFDDAMTEETPLVPEMDTSPTAPAARFLPREGPTRVDPHELADADTIDLRVQARATQPSTPAPRVPDEPTSPLPMVPVLDGFSDEGPTQEMGDIEAPFDDRTDLDVERQRADPPTVRRPKVKD